MFKLNIAARIYILVALSLMTVGLMALLSIYSLNGTRAEQRAKELQSITDSATAIAQAQYDRSLKGEISPADARARVKQILGDIRYRGSEYLFVLDTQGVVVMHPIALDIVGSNQIATEDPTGKPFFAEMINVAKRQGSGLVDYKWARTADAAPSDKLSHVVYFEPWGWVLGTGVYIDDLRAENLKTTLTQVSVTLVIASVLLVLAWFIAGSITKPIDRLAHIMQAVSNGDTNVEIEGTDGHGEMGEMARAVEVFRQNSIERQRLEGQSQAEQQRSAERQHRIDDLIAGFRQSVSAALDIVSANTVQMSTSANKLSDIAGGTAQQTGEASTASQSASENVQSVAAAANELAASIEEISRQVAKTNSIVSDANEATAATNDKVVNLSSAAQKIGEVISLIQDIAEQTNLLALNTSIEAARAGEAGKGFAVVASEVKSLANQTATATEEISTQISDIQSSTTDAVTAIERIAKTMAEVNEYTASIASAVEEQGAATAEISQSVTAAASGTASVVGSLDIVSGSVGDTNQSATEVLAASQDVTKQADMLKSTVDQFLEDVAAA